MQVKPKKHLGQHFLVDKNIARKIVETLSAPSKGLLEVGPGTGVLSNIILEKKIPNYFVIEIDKESVDYLSQHTLPKEQIIFGDFLQYNLHLLFEDKPFSIIGNFPYNISGPILFRVLDFREQVEEVVGMFQKEVVERIVSKPGSKQYGILSVLLQTYYKTNMCFTVNNTVFVPPPKVQSAVLQLIKKDNTPDIPYPLFKNLVKTAFGQRRKTLRNALKKFHFKESDQLQQMLSLRAEKLSYEDFIWLMGEII